MEYVTGRRVAAARTIALGRTHLLATTAIAAALSLGSQPALAQDGDAVPLQTIEVTGQGSASTEGTGSYTTQLSTASLKGTAEIREIPQTVNVVTQQRMDDQNMTQLEDVARWTPGLRVFTNDPGRSSIFSRGFEFDSYYVDGLPAPMGSRNGTVPDLAPFERVEFLKGPSALYSGSGEPGGTVNLVRKRGLDHYQVKATGTYGSWDNARGELDVTGPLNDRVRARAVMAYENNNSFIDYNGWDVGVAYGTVDIDITDRDLLTIGAWYQERDISPSNGLPTLADGTLLDVDTSTFLGADWNSFKNQSTDIIAEYTHSFDSGGEAKVGARYSNRNADSFYAYTGSAASATGATSMVGYGLEQSEDVFSIDAHIDKAFTLLGQEQNVLVGVDYQQLDEKISQARLRGLGTNNVFSPNPFIAQPSYTYSTRTSSDPKEAGIYGQLRLKPHDMVTVVLGGRESWYRADVNDLVSGATTEVQHNANFSPYAGLVVDLNENVSVYASYTQVFQPQTEVDAAGDLLPVRTANQMETGVKSSFFGGRLNGSLAVYQLNDTDRAIADPNAPGSYLASGEIQVRGVEAELSGAPFPTRFPGWELFGSYTYMDMEYKKDSADLTYQYYLPQNMFNVWSKYTFQQGLLEDVHVGAGLNYVSSFHNQYLGLELRQDDYVTVDAQIGYLFDERVQATLTVTNLLDEKYYERLGTTSTFNFYGQPRAFMAKLEATF